MLVQQDRTKPRKWAGGAETNSNGVKPTNDDQQHPVKIDFRSDYYRSQLLLKDPGRLGRKGTLFEYLSENLSKLVILGLVLLSVVILIVVKNKGDSSALLCAQPPSKSDHANPYPNVDFKKVAIVKDKSKYRVFKADRWIIVAVSGPPTDQIRAMVKMPGWQVLAIGDSNTPSNWEVRGAIYLSVEQQAALRFRILAHLPYSSYVRKNVGYLFAIQHGAKMIYDVDENASILGGSLSTVFDIALSSSKSKRESLLQYLCLQNRTTVNPYIHFGQRSVWPRGLPLESVSNINAEIVYGRVPSGKQYIQQGLANGFPDVDSVFYHSRKAEAELFDIKFDSHALPVALPQGTMAPMNSLNTLFHSSAFWALMLPVSVHPQVSDILRGYWAQRLLWEIGGYYAVYPPSIYRVDTSKPHNFEDEKDLPESVERLAEFLVAWTSRKGTFFKKVLDLSHSLATAGFWAAQDVTFTADWLQDLVSVGYLQPSLLALEAEGGKPLSSQLDHMEFVPLALPSIHLGVKESETVAFELGNLLKWNKFFGNIVLILECSWPVNHTAIGWRMLYGRIFKTVVLLSSKKDSKFGVLAPEDSQTYILLPEIFEQHKEAEGFLFMKDYVILNYWNLLQANKTKLWNLHKVGKAAWKAASHSRNGTEWYFQESAKQSVKTMVKHLPIEFRLPYRENIDDKHYVVSKSEVFYVPKRFVEDFISLVPLAIQAKLNQELAIPLIFLSMDRLDNFDSEAFSNVVYKTGSDAVYSAEAHIVRPLKATSQRQLLHIMKGMASGDPLLLEVL
ncbi:hypothetical protein GOP47_0002638 [Adiantum capillus-veneris]|uniref:Uncharacterized protein n=1 Tax=Adiantum capillus-veneris TaxID=13818 RepID=A0A9D4VBB4_ADICA|nr:hypothetical protein GOP47_0002638 [Adiantum capillus-veneris]